jgi:F-type H+/Na+-transporting ATPase subunit alpha
MSQVDRVHFLPTLIWIVIFFLMWYGFVIIWILPMYYKTLRSRVMYEKMLWNEIINSIYLFSVLVRYFEIFFNIIIKGFKLLNIVKSFKNLPLISLENKFFNQKKFYVVTENSIEDEDNIISEDLDNKGVVFKVSDDIAYARGLLNVRMSEMVLFQTNTEELYGIVNYLDNEGVAGITVLGDCSSITANTLVIRTNKQATVKGGYNVLGRVINPIGEALDGEGEIKNEVIINIEKNAPSIIDRKPVREPLETGIKFIDSMIPIGCGQRELIIGDKKTGKTAIAIDTILNQRGTDIICIYVSIGQKKSSIARVVKTLRENNCMSYTVIVAAGASDSAALQFLAPYSGCAIGEFFRDKGRKVLIIYDDLSKHAVAYRQMSLLLRRPPGREGYPGDIFYVHSRLLERAAKLRDVNDNNVIVEGGSLTALPIIETIQGDVSAYIPTNVISITDGQIFLEASLFNRGIRPAISPGISVSRVGSSAQNKVIKNLAGSLKLELAQYREMEEFARLGLSLDESSLYLLEKGRRLVQLLNQSNNNPINMIGQIILLFGGLNGFFSDIDVNLINVFERKIMFLLKESHFFSVLNEIGRTELSEDLIVFILNLVKVYLSNE